MHCDSDRNEDKEYIQPGVEKSCSELPNECELPLWALREWRWPWLQLWVFLILFTKREPSLPFSRLTINHNISWHVPTLFLFFCIVLTTLRLLGLLMMHQRWIEFTIIEWCWWCRWCRWCKGCKGCRESIYRQRHRICMRWAWNWLFAISPSILLNSGGHIAFRFVSRQSRVLHVALRA